MFSVHECLVTHLSDPPPLVWCIVQMVQAGMTLAAVCSLLPVVIGMFLERTSASTLF